MTKKGKLAPLLRFLGRHWLCPFQKLRTVHTGRGPGLGALAEESVAEIGSDALPVEVGVDLVLELG